MAVDIKHKAQGLVTRAQALKSPTMHRFIPKIGYVHYSRPPKSVPGQFPPDRANPPAGTPDGSRHFLAVPGGGVAKMAFTWVASQGAWARPGGLRLAFAADYLSRAGWGYAGPADAPAAAPFKIKES